MIVVSEAWSMKHELAHAASAPLFGSSKIPFLEEGFAEMWSDRTTLPREDLIPYISATQPSQVRYAAAAHFLQWVEENYGATVMDALLSGSERKDDQQERFHGLQEHLGGAFEELQLAFWGPIPYGERLGWDHAGLIRELAAHGFDAVTGYAGDLQRQIMLI